MTLVYLYDKIQRKRIVPLLKTSEKKGILKSKNITFINDINKADIVLVLLNSRNNTINLTNEEKQILHGNDKPKIIVERLDSSVTWVRHIDKIKNFKGIIKNRITHDPNLHNAELYYGRHHYKLMYHKYKCETKEVGMKEKDLSEKFYRGLSYLPPIDKKFLHKIHACLWDFNSSPFGGPCSFAKNREPNFNENRPIDVFCVNRDKKGIQGWSRKRMKNIIKNMKDINSITDKLDKKEYAEKVFQSKICVACWGWGEWVHLDGSAMYAGCILIKPDSGYIKMDPDIYQNNITYVPCAPDFSDLDKVIRKVLDNYDSYKEMRIKNREMLMNMNQKYYANKFWDKVLELCELNKKD